MKNTLFPIFIQTILSHPIRENPPNPKTYPPYLLCSLISLSLFLVRILSFNFTLGLISIVLFLLKNKIEIFLNYSIFMLSYSFSFSMAKFLTSIFVLIFWFLTRKSSKIDKIPSDSISIENTFDPVGYSLSLDLLVSFLILLFLYFFIFHYALKNRKFLVNYKLGRDVFILILFNFLLTLPVKDNVLPFIWYFGYSDTLSNFLLAKLLENVIYLIATKSICSFVFSTCLRMIMFRI